MSITSSPGCGPGLRPAMLLDWAAGQIRHAAAAAWPGADICLHDHVPSATGYVKRLTVDGRPLYAKLSVLGASLVSVLRGLHGTWDQVQDRQRAYAARPDHLLHREAAHLRLLAELGRPRVPAVAGLHHGVLFTEPATGPSLAAHLARHPDQTAASLEEVCVDLQRLHTLDPAVLGTAQVISERSIPATFARKFIIPDSDAYLRQIGAPRLPEAHRRVVEVEMRAAARHVTHRPLPAGPVTLVYGDLKPEHVIHPPDGSGLVLLDPGLRPANAAEDLTRLISRTLLMAVTGLIPGGARTVVEQVAAFVADIARTMPAPDLWLRETTTLWLMDTLNITSTYLTAPPGLPMPPLAHAVTDHATAVAAMVHQASLALTSSADGDRAWERAISCAHTAVTP
ncbi:phosphotransferase [Streptomyces megasporus]|uniref:phosphotransferase n=1 Tax=Streptomyces megasporus TaxID=44060 RepID=UPI00068CE0B7|nr:phosphotransferase [Streptomyces megasporus]